MINTIIKRTNYCGGKGVFANKDFKKGETVFVFRGKKVGTMDCTERSLQIGDDKFITPFKKNPGYFINHSCNPSCGIKDLKKIVAMKKIKKGGEITIDYSFSIKDKHWGMGCNCRQKNCREIIREYKELPKKLKEKYRGWESKFI